MCGNNHVMTETQVTRARPLDSSFVNDQTKSDEIPRTSYLPRSHTRTVTFGPSFLTELCLLYTFVSQLL